MRNKENGIPTSQENKIENPTFKDSKYVKKNVFKIIKKRDCQSK